MEYRELGHTGKKVSVIGLGCEYLDHKPYEQIKETIDVALDGGVNILDVFMPGKEVRENIAKALGSRRDQVMVQGHICSTDIGKQYDKSRDLPTAKKYFEDMLDLFGGYIDLGLFFFIDTEKDFQGVFASGIAEYMQEMKAIGRIGHIGFSSHNTETAMRVIETGIPDMMMFSINPAFDMLPSKTYVFDQMDKNMGAAHFQGIDPSRTALYSLCAQKQIGITVMKSLGAGKLLSPEQSPFYRALTVHQCIHYALSRPAVASALIGCQTGDEMKDVLRYFDLDEQELDYADVITSVHHGFQGSCVYCNHCQPCPVDIDIAAVHRYLDTALMDEASIPESLRKQYGELSRKGSDCTSCGNCEERCPFGVSVCANMAKAAAVFGG